MRTLDLELGGADPDASAPLPPGAASSDPCPPPYSIFRQKPDGTREPVYVATESQREFHSATERNVLYGGAAGGGKSCGLRHEAYFRCMSVPGLKALLVRRSVPELRSHTDNVPFEAELLGIPKTDTTGWNKGESTLRFKNGSSLKFGHVEDDAALTKFLSFEFEFIGIDEAVLLTETQFKFLAGRLRTTKPGIVPIMRLASNPSPQAEGNWVKKYFITKDVSPEEDESYDPADYRFIPAGIKDNPHIDRREYEARLKALPTKALRDAYLHGNWDAIESQFFTEFQPTKDGQPWHVIPSMPCIDGVPITEIPWLSWVRSMDHGWSPDPTIVLWFCLLPKAKDDTCGRIVCAMEMVRRETLPRALAEQMRAMSEGLRIIETVADPSMRRTEGGTGSSVWEQIELNRVTLTRADNDRQTGWAAVHTLLSTVLGDGLPRLQIVGPACPELVASLPMMVAEKNNPHDVAGSKRDHAPDALRYFALSAIVAPSRPPVSKAAPWWKLVTPTRRRLGSENVARSA